MTDDVELVKGRRISGGDRGVRFFSVWYSM